MNDLVFFVIGIIVGATVVGSSVYRTLAVHGGNVNGATYGSVANSLAYYFSVYFIAKDNGVAYIGTAVGSTAIVIWMAYKNRKVKRKVKRVSKGK